MIRIFKAECSPTQRRREICAARDRTSSQPIASGTVRFDKKLSNAKWRTNSTVCRFPSPNGSLESWQNAVSEATDVGFGFDTVSGRHVTKKGTGPHAPRSSKKRWVCSDERLSSVNDAIRAAEKLFETHHVCRIVETIL